MRPERALAWSLTAALTGALAAPASAGTSFPPSLTVIPLPAGITPGDGPGWQPGPHPTIVMPRERAAAGVARWLAGAAHLRVARAGTIRFVRVPGMADEAYHLTIDPQGARIAASTRAGLFYGAVSLRQLLIGRGQDPIAPVRIADAPRFAWRGLLLDSVRHMQSVIDIERLIDLMALHKLNTLQWHLTDDQGWRLQIRRYPALTRNGAWRTTAYGARYGGFYTQADVRRIVAYAAARNVTIVPEIEMPAHTLAAILAMPALGIAGVPASAQADWGIFPAILNVDDATFAVLENVLTEVMALFPSHTIAIGGDEAMMTGWATSPQAQARMKALGLHDEKALQGWFMARMARFLADHGRRAIGWDDLLAAGGVPPDAAMLSWHTAAGAASAMAGGHDVVMATDPVLYFDHRQASDPAEPPGRATVVSLADVYRFDPGAAPADATGHILGLQAQLWTEYMADGRAMLAMAWPRAAALAEVGWTPAAKLDLVGFTARMPLEQALLKTAGVAPTPGAFELASAPLATPVTPGIRLVSQQLRTCTNRLTLNIAGAPHPGGDSPPMMVDLLDRCWLTPPVVLDGARRIVARVAPLPFNYQLAGLEAKIAMRPPSGPSDELVIRRDTCDGPELARLPLSAIHAPGVPAPVATALAAQTGAHVLCITAAARAPAPLWALSDIEVQR